MKQLHPWKEGSSSFSLKWGKYFILIPYLLSFPIYCIFSFILYNIEKMGWLFFPKRHLEPQVPFSLLQCTIQRFSFSRVSWLSAFGKPNSKISCLIFMDIWQLVFPLQISVAIRLPQTQQKSLQGPKMSLYYPEEVLLGALLLIPSSYGCCPGLSPHQ